MVKIQQGEHPRRPLGCDRFSLKDGPVCVLFFTNSHCIFCPAARKMLEEQLEVHELPVDSIREVDCDTADVSDITAIPTIQICGQTIVGLPEEDILDQALWMLRANSCCQEKLRPNTSVNSRLP